MSTPADNSAPAAPTAEQATPTASAAPEAAPATAAPSDEVSDDGDVTDDGFDVASVSDRSGEQAQPAQSTEPAPAQPAAEPAKPAAAPAPAKPEQQPPAAPAASQPAQPKEAPQLPPAGPAVQPPAAQPGQSLEEAVAARAAWRTKTIDALASGHYNLDEATVEQIQTEPEKVIPKLMAKVYLDAAEAATLGVMQHLPRVIQGTIEQIDAARKAEDAFYAAWPALNRETDQQTIMQLAVAFRQTNPNASFEDFTRMVGAQAMVALGRQAPVAAPAPAPQVPPAAPPFKPLPAGAPATGPLTMQQRSTVFEDFAREDEAYDRGE